MPKPIGLKTISYNQIELNQKTLIMRTFHGGVHPAEEKHLTENSAFEIFQPKSQIILPLGQHLGKQANPKVKKGTAVVAW
ncbi:MAG: hypothetical protein MZV64_38280 [Ignavibacteriales bacterium]|nr:hypothetical protein [Ignavibacteriales bacterium]